MNTKYIPIYLILFSYSVIANIIGVPVNYPSIQAAVNASSNGDTILVEQGVYTENINFRGKKIVLTSRYYLTGIPSTIFATVINGSNPTYPDTGSCVIINHGEDSTTVLQGFAITGGKGTRWQDEHGPGNFFREGGGILVQYSSPVIQNNIIYSNFITNDTNVTSTGGAGMRIGDSYPRIYNNIIYGNSAKYGAGIVLNYSGCEIKNNIICCNYGSFQYQGGTGLWILDNFTRNKIIENNTIVNNSATGSNTSGGIFSFNTVALLKNNIIWGNTSPLGIQIIGGGVSVSYCDVQGGYTGIGNLNINPQFADSNYILSVISSCIDKGDSSSAYYDIEDPLNHGFAKFPSRGGLRNDIGAYGGPLAKILSNIVIGIQATGNTIAEDFYLSQNYPNPFNPLTTIYYGVPEKTFVNIRVYDILGREVIVLVNEYINPGVYITSFDGSGFSSGIYFYIMKTGTFSVSRKMLLIK